MRFLKRFPQGELRDEQSRPATLWRELNSHPEFNEATVIVGP
jgi:hypothetical protein